MAIIVLCGGAAGPRGSPFNGVFDRVATHAREGADRTLGDGILDRPPPFVATDACKECADLVLLDGSFDWVATGASEDIDLALGDGTLD